MKGLGLGPDALNPQSFPLPPELSVRLRRISHDCHEGRGFGVFVPFFSFYGPRSLMSWNISNP